MPIYQYRCVECDHQLEALQKISDDKLVDCPKCNLPGLKKQVTAAAFKLKGTGWYETDFKNSGQPPAAKPSSAESANDGVSNSDSSSSESNASGTQESSNNNVGSTSSNSTVSATASSGSDA